jgi:hypothetical protein
MREVPMTFLPPPAGLYYVQVRLTPTAGGHESATVKAIVDLGSPVSIANWVRPRPRALSARAAPG